MFSFKKEDCEDTAAFDFAKKFNKPALRPKKMPLDLIFGTVFRKKGQNLSQS